jgi:hypothetical protein
VNDHDLFRCATWALWMCVALVAWLVVAWLVL